MMREEIKPSDETLGTRYVVKVWDLPVRVFHWAVVVLVTVSVVSGQIGGNLMIYHVYSGYALLTLVLFRLAWGFFGSTYARFTHFLRGPKAMLDYARRLGQSRPSHTLGHNPLGGLMVVALLLALLIQTGTGLFANDDIFTEGPLAGTVSKKTSDWLTGIHEINVNLLLVLIGLHVAAVAFYWLYKKENLVSPMLTGRKSSPQPPSSPVVFPSLWRALLVAGLAILAVYGLVTPWP